MTGVISLFCRGDWHEAGHPEASSLKLCSLCAKAKEEVCTVKLQDKYTLCTCHACHVQFKKAHSHRNIREEKTSPTQRDACGNFIFMSIFSLGEALTDRLHFSQLPKAEQSPVCCRQAKEQQLLREGKEKRGVGVGYSNIICKSITLFFTIKFQAWKVVKYLESTSVLCRSN